MDKQASAANVTEHELAEIRALIEQRSGILFDDSRERSFSPSVRAHMDARRLAHGTELLRLVRNSNAEYDRFLERLLAQETSFNRYPGIFRALETKVLPEMRMKKFWENPRSLRVWSAGCSTGEEPYTIAITIADAFEFADEWNIHILATDISRQALDVCERGAYPARELNGLTSKQRESYFTSFGEGFQVKPKIRNMVTFTQQNLAHAVYLGRFDMIFCMNVMFYFSDEHRAGLIQRFYEDLEPGGYLFLGHAESMAKAQAGFQPIVVGESLIYQKPASGSSRQMAAGQEKM